MNPIISIIIPIYNVESFLRRCIESVISQTYQNTEIILVDDGSTDSSGTIADTYANLDSRIRVIHKPNGGLSSARNAALKIITGDYVTFIDSDDYVSFNYIELLFNALKDNSADISICESQYVYDYDYDYNNKLNDVYSIKLFSSYEAIIETLNIRLPNRAWGKLYKTELFKTIQFPEGLLYEDLAVVFDLLILSNTVVYVNTPAYYYMIRNGSIMQSSFNLKQAVEIEIIDSAMDRVLKFYPDLQILTDARRVYSYLLVLKRILLSSNPNSYLSLRHEIKNKIRPISLTLLCNSKVKFSLKIKIASYLFSEKSFMRIQRLADKRNPEASK